MSYTGSVGCQNCIALNKKLELFDLLKQKCCKTDDITKNFLLLKTSYEKSAKLLENKSKKLSETRSKLKDAAKAEEISKRKAAEFQLRLVSSDMKCQDLLTELDVERQKNASLLQEKCHFENLVETKENEITSLNIISKQCEEKFLNDMNSLNAKMEKKIGGLKAEIQKQQELNSKLKGQGNQKKKHDKLREDIVDIFKDGFILAGEPLKRFKKLFNRLQENEAAAKLEAILDTPSMTPDGTTSSDTGVFSGDEDFGCPSLGNDLEMSSDSDEDFENVELQSDALTCSKMSKGNSSPSEDRSLTMEPDTELMQDTSGSNVSNDSVNDGDSTLCPIFTDSIADHSDKGLKLPVTSASVSDNHVDSQEPVGTSANFKLSAKAESLTNIVGCYLNVNNHASLMSPLSSPSGLSPKSISVNPPSTTNEPVAVASHTGITDSLFSPPGGDISPSLKGQERKDTYELSFDVSSVPSDKCSNSNEMASRKSDAKSEIVTSKLDSKLSDISVPSSAEELTNTANSLCSLKALEESQIPLSDEKEEPSGNSKDICLRSDIPSACSTPAAEFLGESSHNSIEADAVSDENRLVVKDASSIGTGHDGLAKILQDYKKGYSNFVKGETFIPSEDGRSTKKNKKNMPSNNSSKSDISAALSKLSVFKYQPPSDKPTSCAVNIHHDLSDDSIKETKVQEDEMDLDTMLHEWNPPTPILPFSDDSCGFDSTLSSTVPEESPQKCSVTISVGTNTDIAHCRSTASSPISHLFVENSSSSSDQGSQHERSFKDAYSSPPKVSSCNRASSPMKIRYKNIGVMPIAEFSRTVAVSPVKVMKNTSATSPLRSLFRDVSVGPIQVETLDCATNTSNSGNSASIDFENGDESWSREAKMLQQTLEVLGISTGVSSGGVLDQSLVDELRKAMEMALRKTSKTDDIPRKRQTPSKQFDTSYCSFNPCEFAEICNQQHYNLHLLAKGKNVEKTMCSREKRRQKNLKRLNVSSHRRRSLSTLSFKEEIVEEDYSSQKEKQLINLSDDSITMKELSESNRSNLDTLDSDDSFNIRPAISPTRSFTKSVPHPEDVDRSKPVKQMNNTKSQVSAKNPTRRKSFVPEAIHPPKNNRPKVDVSGSNSSVDKNESAFCIPEDASSDAPEVDFCPIDKTSPEIEKNSMGLATVTETNVIPQSEPNLNDSDSSEDNLIIDESISSTTTVLPKVSECNASAEVPCKPPAHEEESSTPDNDHFVLPKPRRMSLRKRRQSSSSESSTAENSPGMNDSSVVPRRSPRMKKIRMANDGQSKVLQDCQKGYSNSRKGEMSVSSEGGRSTEKNNPGHNSPNSKISDALSKLSAFKFQSPVGKNLDEQATSDSITSVPESVQRISPNTSLSNKPLKRSAENKSMEEESSKRLKHPSNARPNVENDSAIVQKVSNLSEVVENGPEDSDTDMECDEKLSVGTANTKATYKSSTARKPSKLQKLRSTVSKVHPMVQGTKNTRSPGAAKEHLQESADQCMENPHGLKSESTINPKLVENFEDEASILERIRGRGNIRMAAAASGRTAQLIQVKPGAKRHQRPPPPNSPADYMPAKPLPRAARTQPLVRPADRVSALGRSIPSETTEKSTDSIPSTRNESTPQSPARFNENCQSSIVLNVHKVKSERSLIDTEVSVHLGKETYKSCFISDIGLRISTYSPLVCALTEQENSQPPTSNKIELIRTQVLVATTLKDFIAAPSFTSSVLQKAVDALSAPTLYNIMPVLVQNVVKMMDDDFDTAPLRLGNQQSFVPPLTPVQQQLVTLIVQLSSQHQHLQQLPHQLLRLLEYRVFRLGVTPEGDRLAWCSKLHAAICRIHRLRSQALIFCWDSLYTLRGRSYHVVKAVMDVWPHLFPVNPSFEKACPNAQVLLHLLRSFVEHKNGAQQSHFDNSWLKRLLRSGGIQSLSINSSILASTIFSNIISGAADTNVPALVLLAKREEENWTMRDIVSMKLLPALDKWCKKSLNDSAAERVIWILCSILRALPPERNGNTSDTLMKLLISELLKPETSLAPQMQEVIALGLVLLSRHNVENVAVALASWNPKYGPSRGYSSRLLQYLTSAVNSGTRPVLWWQNVAVKYSKCQLED